MMAMRYLGEHAENARTYSARDIADAYDIPLPVLAKTLQRLARAKLVASQHGATRDYMLARSADRINAFDIICAFDGPPVIARWSSLRGRCSLTSHCKVQEPLQRVNESIRMLFAVSPSPISQNPDKRR